MPTCLPSNTYAGVDNGLYLPKSGPLIINGTLRIDGNPTAGTSLRVTGATFLGGNVDVTGAVEALQVRATQTIFADNFVGLEDTPAKFPTGAVGFFGAPLSLPSGARCPILLNTVELTGNGIPIPYPLNEADVGTYIALSKFNGSTGPFIINFTVDTFPEGGTFFIKNVDKDDTIDIYFNGANIGAFGSPNSTLLPTNVGAGSNGFLCVARYQGGFLKVY